MPPKKITLTNAQKHEFCLYARDNKRTQAQYVYWIEEKWGVKIHESTVTRILQSSDKRLTSEVANPEAKRYRSITVPELELALKEFVLCYQHQTILSDTMLIEKAKLLASGLEVSEDTLQFSSSWLHKFKDRNGIHQEKLHGEADSANNAAIIENLPLLHEKCANYSFERIYNMDETGLFYRLEPDRTLATKYLSERKKNKECITIALCANSDGSHKLKPLIIGKCAKPRCFKNINISNLPIIYRHNSKAWMLLTTFQEWLQNFDLQMSRKYNNQRVLLFLDNCPCHKIEGLVLSHVDVVFLPSNTRSKLQPMDAGIIMLFKNNYRHHQIQWMLEQVEIGKSVQNLKMDILKGIQYSIQAWDEVKAKTIRNCWYHTKILPINENIEENIENLENIQENDLPIKELSEELEALNFSDGMKIEEFLNLPDENIIYEILDDNDIITELVDTFKKKTDESLDDDDDSIEIEPISISTVSNSLENIRAFLLQQEGGIEYFKSINTLEKFIKEKKKSLMKQTTLENFFNK